MQFDTINFDEDAWKGSGTVVGEHTYAAPILLGEEIAIQAEEDDENKLEFTVEGVSISKKLMANDVVTPAVVDPTNAQNFVSFESTGVLIEQDLRIQGNLHVAGWPPPGGDMSLPTDPTFNTVTTNGDITHQSLSS